MTVQLTSRVRPVQVGDVIRSLDFPGRFDCYMIGLVVDADEENIRCRGIARVWAGQSEGMDREFTTVQPGVHFMDQTQPGRIEIVG